MKEWIGCESGSLINEILEHARESLSFDVVFLVEYDKELAEVVAATGSDFSDKFHVGVKYPLGDTYSYHALHGDLPFFIADTHADSKARELPLTRMMGIRSFASSHVRLGDGRVFGALCCLSRSVNTSSAAMDLKLLRVLANLIGSHMDRQFEVTVRKNAVKERIQRVIENQAFQTVFQPIMDLRSNQIVGYEALSRFNENPYRTPDKWFSEAKTVGMSVDLEIAAFARALSMRGRICDRCYLSVNLSPETLVSERFLALIGGAENCHSNLVVEVTEHMTIDDYLPLTGAVERVKNAGIRVAVDDVGAGYAGLRHIIQINPSIIKLDMSLTRDVHCFRSKQAMISALSAFAARMGIKIVAEGVEVREELDALRILGIDFAQGYLIGRPASVPRSEFALDICEFAKCQSA